MGDKLPVRFVWRAPDALTSRYVADATAASWIAPASKTPNAPTAAAAAGTLATRRVPSDRELAAARAATLSLVLEHPRVKALRKAAKSVTPAVCYPETAEAPSAVQPPRRPGAKMARAAPKRKCWATVVLVVDGESASELARLPAPAEVDAELGELAGLWSSRGYVADVYAVAPSGLVYCWLPGTPEAILRNFAGGTVGIIADAAPSANPTSPFEEGGLPCVAPPVTWPAEHRIAALEAARAIKFADPHAASTSSTPMPAAGPPAASPTAAEQPTAAAEATSSKREGAVVAMQFDPTKGVTQR